jgi:hypothetical protein
LPHIIFLQGDFITNRFARRAGPIYDPTQEAGLGGVHFLQAEFDPPNDCILEVVGAIPEARFYQRSGLAQLLDPSAGGSSFGVLQVLDAAKDDTTASPLFRAWLSIRLYRIASLQPHEWGVSWAPAAAADHQKLIALGAEQIRSGDWLQPRLNAQRGVAFERFFAQARALSYVSQARFHHKLSNIVLEHGLRLCGYAKLDGGAKLVSEPSQAVVFWSSPVRQPSIAKYPAAITCVPLTPVYAFDQNRADLVRSTANLLRVDLDRMRPFLPPFYAAAL